MTLGLGTRRGPDRGRAGHHPSARVDAAAHGGPEEAKASPTWAETPGDLVRVSPLPWHFLIRSREAPTRVLLLPWGCIGDRQAVQLKALEAWVEESECPGSSLPLCLAAVDGGP